MFDDMGSAPATLEASRDADLFGSAPGNDCQMADAIQAYIQANLTGTPCWVCLPPDDRPECMKGFRRPVVRLKKALYGHPDSGTYWEKHCDAHLTKVGFKPVGKEWPSCYIHPLLKLFLIVYVDDFKMAGPKHQLEEAWKLIRTKITLDEPRPFGRFLGCEHRLVQRVSPITGRTVTAIEYDMSEFLSQCVEVYCKEFNVDRASLRKKAVSTPFLSGKEEYVHECGGHCSKCGALCCSGNRDDLRKIEREKERHAHPGSLHKPASRVLMKVLYASRMARPDLLKVNCSLASEVSKWDSSSAERLHRMLCYVEQHKHMVFVGWCGDSPADLSLEAFAGAGFASDYNTAKSTTGGIIF
mgnify:CR=1 FL=1